MRGTVIVKTAERFGGRRIDRIGPMDLTVLATDRGSVPMNIGALLEFGTAGGVHRWPPSAPSWPNECRRFPGCVSGCGAFRSAAAAQCGSMIPTSCSIGT
jgi:hypothetical protein